MMAMKPLQLLAPFEPQDSPFASQNLNISNSPGQSTRTSPAASTPTSPTASPTAATAVSSSNVPVGPSGLSSVPSPLTRAPTASVTTATPASGTAVGTSTTLSPKKLRLTLPVAYIDDDDHSLQAIDQTQPKLATYLKRELDVSRIVEVHKHLWWTGLPIVARPLHRQVSIGRNILLTEKADLHLLWFNNAIYIKPLPEFLMDYDTWMDHICHDRELYEDATGFLLSYLWLICRKSDLKIAHEKGLLSSDITWVHWISFSKAVMSRIHYSSLENVNPRYMYGEIRLQRLNWVYRLCPKTTNLRTFIRGYEYKYLNYSTFLESNSAWLVVVFVYITIVLTAMQVGLGTTELRSSDAFNRASYGFTVFAILAPLAGVFGMFVILVGLVFYNLIYTLSQRGKKRKALGNVFDSSLKQFNH